MANKASAHDGIRAGGASKRRRSRATSSIRSAISMMPNPATQIGTNGACGSRVANRNTPSQRICAADNGGRSAVRDGFGEAGFIETSPAALQVP